jgi:hypothetical protein
MRPFASAHQSCARRGAFGRFRPFTGESSPGNNAETWGMQVPVTKWIKLPDLSAGANGLRFNEELDGAGGRPGAHACRLGAEGIVSKRRDAPYRSGRTRTWLKVKNPKSPAVMRIEDGTW